jgi:cob(I)alamin adenosyltransferase
MVRINKVYTRTGDDGSTGLGDGSRRSKADLRVAAVGDLDEANAVIGLARREADAMLDAVLARIQNDLFDLGADLCTPGIGGLRIVDSQVEALEVAIDAATAALTPLKSFILPGGSAASSWLHLARTVVRRAERGAVALNAVEPLNEAAMRYLNRLSDLLFVLGRQQNDGGAADVLWVPGANR